VNAGKPQGALVTAISDIPKELARKTARSSLPVGCEDPRGIARRAFSHVGPQ